MSLNTLQIYKNNSNTLVVNVTDNNGLMYNCTGYTPYFSVKNLPSDLTYLINLTGTTGSTSGATLTFYIPSTATNLAATEYFYDVTIINGSIVYTVIYDKLRILENSKYGN
jgi:hypothetical protein